MCVHLGFTARKSTFLTLIELYSLGFKCNRESWPLSLSPDILQVLAENHNLTRHADFSFPSFFSKKFQIPSLTPRCSRSSGPMLRVRKYPILPDLLTPQLSRPPVSFLEPGGEMLEVQFPVLLQLECLLIC